MDKLEYIQLAVCLVTFTLSATSGSGPELTLNPDIGRPVDAPIPRPDNTPMAQIPQSDGTFKAVPMFDPDADLSKDVFTGPPLGAYYYAAIALHEELGAVVADLESVLACKACNETRRIMDDLLRQCFYQLTGIELDPRFNSKNWLKFFKPWHRREWSIQFDCLLPYGILTCTRHLVLSRLIGECLEVGEDQSIQWPKNDEKIRNIFTLVAREMRITDQDALLVLSLIHISEPTRPY